MHGVSKTRDDSCIIVDWALVISDLSREGGAILILRVAHVVFIDLDLASANLTSIVVVDFVVAIVASPVVNISICLPL